MRRPLSPRAIACSRQPVLCTDPAKRAKAIKSLHLKDLRDGWRRSFRSKIRTSRSKIQIQYSPLVRRRIFLVLCRWRHNCIKQSDAFSGSQRSEYDPIKPSSPGEHRQSSTRNRSFESCDPRHLCIGRVASLILPVPYPPSHVPRCNDGDCFPFGGTRDSA